MTWKYYFFWKSANLKELFQFSISYNNIPEHLVHAVFVQTVAIIGESETWTFLK